MTMFTAILIIFILFILYKFGIFKYLLIGILGLGAMFMFGLWAAANANLDSFLEYAMVGAMIGFPILLLVSFFVFLIVQVKA